MWWSGITKFEGPFPHLRFHLQWLPPAEVAALWDPEQS